MKIGIVNDMAMAVEILSKLVERKTDHQVIWTAFNGLEAVEKCREQTPDLILMDLIMPIKGGVDATADIMKDNPCAILIVTASIKENLEKVFDAMGHGALDVVRTPSLDFSSRGLDDEELLKKIETIGYIINFDRNQRLEKSKKEDQLKGEAPVFPPLFIVGASTGGPHAIAKVFAKIPENPMFASVIIQHVDSEFSSEFARWLYEQTGHKVTIVKEGMIPEAGNIYVPNQNAHLLLSASGAFYYSEKPLNTPFMPSVDVFFESAAENWPHCGVATLLTGMGVDGALGMKALYDRGWLTIAEDEETCVVFGMPKKAIALGAAGMVLPNHGISKVVNEYFKKQVIVL